MIHDSAAQHTTSWRREKEEDCPFILYFYPLSVSVVILLFNLGHYSQEQCQKLLSQEVDYTCNGWKLCTSDLTALNMLQIHFLIMFNIMFLLFILQLASGEAVDVEEFLCQIQRLVSICYSMSSI